MASVAPIPGRKNHLMIAQLSFPTLAWVNCMGNFSSKTYIQEERLDPIVPEDVTVVPEF
jgi:hypothetical protein